MRVAVFGLGYIGTVCGTCLAHHGHIVTGVDVQEPKVDMINSGIAPVVEPGLQDMLTSVVATNALSATAKVHEAMTGAEVILVCVGTPSRSDGSPDLHYLDNVMRQIGDDLSAADDYPIIAIRSTIPPGTLARCSEILEQTSGRIAGKDFGVAANPEFLREGSALDDFFDPAYTLIGTEHCEAAEVLKELYGFTNAPVLITEPGAAELIKYINNSFHALKIAFANEVGTLCKALGIDSHCLMDLVCTDTKLNISPAYLKPGFAYGGSCLPKDLEALNAMVREADLEAPVLSSIAKSNQAHLEKSLRVIQAPGNKRLGFLGLSFKANTDDLRESPAVKVVEALLNEGYEIRIYDPNVNVARLVGSNRAYADTHINHLSDLLVDSVEELTAFAETIVVTNDDSHYSDVLDRVNGHHSIVDLARLPGSPGFSSGRYHGICW